MSEPEVVSTDDTLGGEPRLAGTRIGVSHVVQYADGGWTIDRISRELDIEPLEAVKALEYYYRNPREIRSFIRERKSRGNSLKEDEKVPEKA